MGLGVEDEHAFDDVAQLADVAGPVILLEGGEGGSVISTCGRPYCWPNSCEEFAGEQRDVFLAVAQRRNEEGDDVEAVEEVFAEVAAGDLFFEVFIGGGDDAGVDVDGSAGADGIEALFVQSAQNLCLRLQAHVADFVEEEGAAIGALEGAALFGWLAGSTGTGAVAIAKELGLDEVFGDGGAVEFDKDAIAAERFGMDGAGDEFFAGAGLAEDEYAAVGRRHEFDLLAQGFEGDGLAGEGAFGELAGELLVVFAELVRLDGVAQHEQCAVERERLFEEVVGAELGGADGGFDGAVAGDHDDFGRAGAGRCGLSPRMFGEDVEAVAVGQPDVEEHGLVVSVAQKLEGFGRGAGGGDDVVFLAQDGFQRFADVGFVVNDENMVHKCR